MGGRGLDSKQVFNEPLQFLRKHLPSLSAPEKRQPPQMALLEAPHRAFALHCALCTALLKHMHFIGFVAPFTLK